jgi:hypothetical protein
MGCAANQRGMVQELMDLRVAAGLSDVLPHQVVI